MAQEPVEVIYREESEFLTPKECQDIIDIWPTLIVEEAKVYTDAELNDEVPGHNDFKFRSGMTGFCLPFQVPHWTKILHFLNKYNLEQCINLNGSFEVQLSKYEVGDRFRKHQDVSVKQWSRMMELNNTRKISGSIQLSAPEDYTGGEFVFLTEKTKEGSKGINMDTKQGTIFCFPSYCEHAVEEIKSGTRYSLVFWAKGPFWK